MQDGALLTTLPLDFMGLSYESAQLGNPAFFAAENAALITLFRELGREGVLRLGGGTSEFTAFAIEEPKGLPPFDAVGSDTSKNVKSETPITPQSLRNLRAFLDATNWRCLYGLNLGRGTAAHRNLLELSRNSTHGNLFDVCGMKANSPFQNDGNLGGTAGMMEMLLQSHGGVVRLVRALPKAWAQGNFKGLRVRGGLEVDCAWSGGKAMQATLRHAESGVAEFAVAKGATYHVRFV